MGLYVNNEIVYQDSLKTYALNLNNIDSVIEDHEKRRGWVGRDDTIKFLKNQDPVIDSDREYTIGIIIDALRDNKPVYFLENTTCTITDPPTTESRKFPVKLYADLRPLLSATDSEMYTDSELVCFTRRVLQRFNGCNINEILNSIDDGIRAAKFKESLDKFLLES